MKETLLEAAEEVFDELGNGWSESIYHSALERELSEKGVAFTSEGTLSVMYKGTPVGRRRPDLFVVSDTGGKVVVELKAGSDKGSKQLEEYIGLTEADSNLGEMEGAAIIRFNDEVDYEYIEL